MRKLMLLIGMCVLFVGCEITIDWDPPARCPDAVPIREPLSP